MSGSGAVDVDEIRHRAFQLWTEDGCPEGRAVDYWLRAETELAAAGAAPEPAEVSPPAPDEPPPAPRAARRAGKPKAGAEPAQVAPSGGEQAERRETLVQQRRTRNKAEG